MPTRNCAVSFADVRGIRHVEVQAESLFEAAILDVRRLKSYPWIEHVGRPRCSTEERETAAKHAITKMQVA